ncbi:hypothetical protein BH09MYX1_BH09MYX1_53620 [soil metagenome]
MGDTPVAATPDGGTPDAAGGDSGKPAEDAATGTDAADAQSVPVPATLAGVVTWLDAQQTSTVTVAGGKVTRWADRTNFQHDAVSDVGYEPTLGTDISKNVPIVRFSSAQMVLNGAPADASLQLGATDDFLVEIVMMNTGSGAVLFHNMSTIMPAAGLNIAIISGEPKQAFGLGYNATFLRDPTPSTDGKLRLFGFQRTSSGTTIAIRNNGAETATTTVTAADLTTVMPFRLGAFLDTHASFKGFMTGAIGELVLVKGAISPNDRTALESYLMTKWKLP